MGRGGIMRKTFYIAMLGMMVGCGGSIGTKTVPLGLCGDTGQPCCDDGGDPYCSPNNNCQRLGTVGLVCTPCGGQGEDCCYDPLFGCDADLECQSGTCVSCGGVGEVCCASWVCHGCPQNPWGARCCNEYYCDGKLDCNGPDEHQNGQCE